MDEHDHTDCPLIEILAISYDGPSVFLQGENGVALTIKGELLSNTLLEDPTIYIDVFATFLDTLDEQGNQNFINVDMQANGGSVVSLRSSRGNQHIYTFKASYKSVFVGYAFGRVNIRATFEYAPEGCIFAAGVDVRGVIVVSQMHQEENLARFVGAHAGAPNDFDRSTCLGDQGPGIVTCPAAESELMVERPITPFDQRQGDQGPGAYIGRGEDANWERGPSPAPSNATTIPNTEVDEDSIPDTASQGGRMSPELGVFDVQLPPLPHD